jgi:hypothetical protein
MGEKSKESLLSKGVRFYVGSKRVLLPRSDGLVEQRAALCESHGPTVGILTDIPLYIPLKEVEAKLVAVGAVVLSFDATQRSPLTYAVAVWGPTTFVCPSLPYGFFRLTKDEEEKTVSAEISLMQLFQMSEPMAISSPAQQQGASDVEVV